MPGGRGVTYGAGQEVVHGRWVTDNGRGQKEDECLMGL